MSAGQQRVAKAAAVTSSCPLPQEAVRLGSAYTVVAPGVVRLFEFADVWRSVGEEASGASEAVQRLWEPLSGEPSSWQGARFWSLVDDIEYSPSGSRCPGIGEYVAGWAGLARLELGLTRRRFRLVLEGTEEVAPEVVKFCERHGVLERLVRALGLARGVFTLAGRLDAQVESDPETGEEWVAVTARVRGDTESIRGAYRRYVREWSSETPWPAAGLVRLVYMVAR